MPSSRKRKSLDKHEIHQTALIFKTVSTTTSSKMSFKTLPRLKRSYKKTSKLR
jgi:hypothetical protein